MKFEKYFPLPWKSDHIVYLWSTNNQTPAMIDDNLWTSEDNDLLDKICKMINGEIEPTFENVIYDREDQTIRSNNHTLLIVRGWGFLHTHLDSKEAAKVQDEMGEWIADKLTKK
jgi:hypothetical protein